MSNSSITNSSNSPISSSLLTTEEPAVISDNEIPETVTPMHADTMLVTMSSDEKERRSRTNARLSRIPLLFKVIGVVIFASIVVVATALGIYFAAEKSKPTNTTFAIYYPETYDEIYYVNY
ncbi:uncharacterized protein LOC101242212 [Ciona intestinalis]